MAARTYPLVRQFTAGEVEVGAYLNAVGKAVGFALAPPIFQARQTVAQSLPNNTFTALLLDTEDFDSDAAHSTVTNTQNWVCQVAGTYAAAGIGGWVGNATGSRQMQLAKNGTAINGSQAGITGGPFAATSYTQIVPLTFFTAVVGDIITLQSTQASGGALNTWVTSAIMPMLTIWAISR